MKKFILVCLILGVAIGIAVLAYKLRPEVETTEPTVVLPMLKVIEVHSQLAPIVLSAQGNVEAGTQTLLSAEVAGRVLEVSERFDNGMTFKKGDVLLRIDASDYEAALAQAQANLARSALALAQEEAAAEQAGRDWGRLGRGEATQLTLRKPQLASAQAEVASAQATVKKAKRDLERTQIVAPYDGRVVTTFVDLGDYVTGRGARIAQIYATDIAEVRLSLNDTEYALLALNDVDKPKVSLSLEMGDDTFVWNGVIDRSESTVDERTRLRYVVARIDGKPFERDEKRPALKPGMFVNALIEARQVEGAFVIPRAALLDTETILLVDDEDSLHRRKVDVFFADSQKAVITQGLSNLERVVITPMEYIVEGMKVDASLAGDEQGYDTKDKVIADGERNFGQSQVEDKQ